MCRDHGITAVITAVTILTMANKTFTLEVQNHKHHYDTKHAFYKREYGA